jgi:hypothetical protein
VLLWLHECCRQFRDRLIDDTDKDWFNNQLEDKLRLHLGMEMKREEWQDIIFGDFMEEGLREYRQIFENQDLMDRLNLSLEKYNSDSTS